MIDWTGKRLIANGHRAPRYHAVSHPRGGEAEAFNRLGADIVVPALIADAGDAAGSHNPHSHPRLWGASGRRVGSQAVPSL